MAMPQVAEGIKKESDDINNVLMHIKNLEAKQTELEK